MTLHQITAVQLPSDIRIQHTGMYATQAHYETQRWWKKAFHSQLNRCSSQLCLDP